MQPTFVTYDDKQREQLLSQTGSFTPNERELFHALAKNWSEQISFPRIATIAGKPESNIAKDVASLGKKLHRERMGVLRTKVVEGQQVPDHLVMCDRGSDIFYRAAIDETFTRLYVSIVNPLPLESVLKEEIGDLPAHLIETIQKDELDQWVDKESSDRVLRLPTLDKEVLIVSARNLKPLLQIAIMRLRYYMSSTQMLEIISKIAGTSIIELRDKVTTKDPSFWHELTVKLIESRKEISYQRGNALDKAFFYCADLLRSVIDAQVKRAETKRKRNEERKLDLEALVMAVKEVPDLMMEEAHFNRVIEAQREKYGADFEDFRNHFYEKHTKSGESNRIPTILLIDHYYIHRDNFPAIFLDRLKSMSLTLHAHFVDEMERQLKTNNAHGGTAFFSLDNFDDAIRSFVRENDFILAAVVKKPALLAETIIHGLKRDNPNVSTNEIKAKLGVYFEPETLKPLPLHEWFTLRLVDIFEQAFDRLHIIRRIWIRITGRYDSFRSSFAGKAINSQLRFAAGREDSREAVGTRPSRGGGVSAPSRTGRRAHASVPTSDRGKDRNSSRSASKRPETYPDTRPDSALTKEELAKKRAYSKKQVESAWDEFGKTLKSDK